MTDAGLELARYYLEEGRLAKAVRQVIHHLEQQAAPEERHKSLTLADLFEVCEKLAEDVRLLKFPPEGDAITLAEARRRAIAGLSRREQDRKDGVEREALGYAPPEAAPERATRDEDRCSATGCFIQRKNHEGVATHPFRETRTPVNFMPLSPSAVQGEERTADSSGVLYLCACKQAAVGYHSRLNQWVCAKHSMGDTLMGVEHGMKRALAVLETEMAERASRAASSSPTATAQRGETAPTMTDLMVEPETISGYLKANPLPAQTEPGERRCPQCDSIIPGLRRFCTTCGMSTPLDLPKGLRYSDTPTTPSPAPECAHVWQEVQLSGRILSNWKLGRIMVCWRCTGLKWSNAPSLPTEGAGP